MDISQAKSHYVFSTEIKLDEGDSIVLREPTTLELRDLGNEKDENNAFDVLYKIFDNCLISHTFTDGDKKADDADVIALLKSSGSRFAQILEAWMNSLPLKKRIDQT